MQQRCRNEVGRTRRFFYIALCHDSLENYYMQNYYLMFDLHQDMKYWDTMLPFEREVYLSIHMARLEEQRKREGLT